MRALFALATLLGCTVGTLMATLSAQEFARWRVYMAAEQLGPEWRAVQRAELLAALANGGQYRSKSGQPFAPADFARADPWAVQEPLTPEQEAERLQREYDDMLARLQAEG